MLERERLRPFGVGGRERVIHWSPSPSSTRRRETLKKWEQKPPAVACNALLAGKRTFLVSTAAVESYA